MQVLQLRRLRVSAYLRTYATHALKEAAALLQLCCSCCMLKTYETHALKEAVQVQQVRRLSTFMPKKKKAIKYAIYAETAELLYRRVVYEAIYL